MSRMLLASEMEGLYGILYELVRPMLASDSCVKCITEDGSATFTSDPEHLLRNVDMEHPAGDLVLKALQSHKRTFGTGTKTLLFMLASLAKAVVQLSKLGIHSDDSLDVIREILTDLAKEVQEIYVDTNECFHSSKQENFRKGKTKNFIYNKNDTYGSEESDTGNHKSHRKLTACDKTEACHSPEAVLQQHLEKQSLLNIRNDIVPEISGSEVREENCLLPAESSFMLYSGLTTEYADSLPDLCHKLSLASSTTKECNSNVAQLELNSITCHIRDGETSCSDQEIVTDLTEMWNQEGVCKSADGEIKETLWASTDPVHLKMSNLQDLSGSTDDIDWFFDNLLSYPDCTRACFLPAGDHVSQDITESSNGFLNCFLSPGHQDYRTFCIDSPGQETQWTGVNINPSLNKLEDLHNSKSELQNMDCINHENKYIADILMRSLISDEQHSSDSENCFEEYDMKTSLEVFSSISSGEDDKGNNVSMTESHLVSESDFTGSKLFSNFTHNAFNEDSKFLLADNQFTQKDYHNDEFDACFSDTDMHNSSVTFENALIKRVNGSEYPSSCLMADNQLSEKDDDNDEFDACFSDIGVDGSSMTHEHAFIKHVNGTEYPSLDVLEMLNNRKQNNLLPEEPRTLCSVKITGSMSGSDLTETVFYRKDQLKDTIKMLSMESSDITTQKSEIGRLNAVLELFRAKKSPADLPKSSRHFDYFQSKNLQPEESVNNIAANITDISTCGFVNLTETTQCNRNLKDTLELGDNLSISTYDVKNTLKGQEYYDTHTIHPYKSSLQEHSRDTNSSDKTKTGLYTSDGNRHKSTSWNKDRQELLDQLLFQKKASFRSSITKKAMLSSRHVSKDNLSRMSCNSSLHEGSRLTEYSSNMDNEYISDSNHIVTQNLNNGFIDCYENSNSLVQNESVAMSESSDDRPGDFTHFQDHHVEHACSETSDMKCVQGSACCCPAEVLCSLSGDPTELSSAKQLQEVINCLHDCKSDVGDAAMYIFLNQIKDKEDARFNLHLVNCLLLPSLTSLPSSFTSSWRSLTSPVSVIPGLIIPCDTQFLEKLHINGQLLVTLLISGDLTPNFHHKGYVPTLTKKTLIAKPHDGNQESDERVWCTDMFDILSQLNVKLLLVKGKASSILLDMCESAGVLLLTNISYHTLSILSHLHKVDIVTYLALATVANLCTVCLWPLSSTWMDHFQGTQLNTGSQFAVITRAPDVQTAIIHCSNTMSAQLLEERLWKCLHSVANSQTDAKVLPGQGKTETWCANRIRSKSGCNQYSVRSVILEAVADIFEDYNRTVMLNTQFNIEEHTKKKNDTETNPVPIPQCRANVGLSEQNCYSKMHRSSHETRAFAESQTNSENVTTGGRNYMKQSVNMKFAMFKSSESCHLKSISGCNMPDTSSENNFYDNFKSKMSAWKTAVDIVSILQNLGSLVISGIDTVDITESMSLL